MGNDEDEVQKAKEYIEITGSSKEFLKTQQKDVSRTD